MRRILTQRPSPAMIVAVLALVAALAGTAVAADKLGLSAFSKGAKNKTVGVGKLTYVSSTVTLQDTSALTGNLQQISANCPAGLKPIGGGIRLEPADDGLWFADSYLTATGFAGSVSNQGPTPGATATITIACASSRAVTGALPAS
jgi:hypothetical protein